MSKRDYMEGTPVSFDMLIKYWKYVLYVLLFNIVIIRHTNPLFKITIAAYVGVETIIGIAYAPIIYHKTKGHETPQNTGIIPKITGFIPNILYKVSLFIVDIMLKVLRKNHGTRSLDIESCASTMTYCFIYFRKIFALTCGILITHEDDESSHIKALTIYTLCSWIQMKFISNIDKYSTSKATKEVESNFFQSLQYVLQSTMKKREQVSYKSLKKFRITILYTMASIVVLFVFYTYEHVSESLDYKFIWTLLLKCIIITDSIFTCSFCVELFGLDLYIFNKGNTIV